MVLTETNRRRVSCIKDGVQIGWRSTSGLENVGMVIFEPVGPTQTRVDVLIAYNPPAGVVGDLAEHLGAGARFDQVLQHDLDQDIIREDSAADVFSEPGPGQPPRDPQPDCLRRHDHV